MKKILIACLVFCCISLLNGCYTLSGSSIDPTWETIQIDQFANYAPLQNPTLSLEFTNDLQDIFRNRTKLNLTNVNGDLKIEGEITTYQVTSLAIQAGEVAAKNRLTIGVRVRYENTKSPNKSFDKTFSDYEDFDGNQTLQQNEAALVDAIDERLINQIFNTIAMDW